MRRFVLCCVEPGSPSAHGTGTSWLSTALCQLTSISDNPGWGWCDALAVTLRLAESATTAAHKHEVLWWGAPLAAVLHVAVAEVTVVSRDDQPGQRPMLGDRQQAEQHHCSMRVIHCFY
jgi:hypothetical protein